MELVITEDDLISNIQSEFHKNYNWLKMEFYKNPHEFGKASPDSDKLQATIPIEDIRMFHCSGIINIDPERNVAQLEHEFFIRFGLCIQILYRSGLLWLQTTANDAASLGYLNERAKQNNTPEVKDLPTDYNLEDVS